MKVCIAEKPSVAKEIAFILGAKSRRDGYFEGNGYQVTWTFGHLCTLKMPDDYKAEWKRWDLNLMPILPQKFETKVVDNSGVKKQFKIIKSLFKSAEVVINCGDAGQEGELIQRWVMKEAGYKGKVLRLWISSLTAEAIKQGFQNLKNASNYDNLYYAGSSRAIGDWLLGMNATRLYTLKFGGYKQLLSIGRVQTPTLAMLVKRHYEIINFKPEPYWELTTLYRETTFNYVKGRFTAHEEGTKLLEQTKQHPFKITSVVKKDGKEYAPRLFDLTSLQVYCNQRFSYSADQTLKIVQKLYEDKIVTYPRVDTTYLPNDVYPKIAGTLGRMKQYSQYTQSILGQKIRKSSKVFNDKKVTDHHAIIPTGYEKNIAGAHFNVYDAIARRFIAVFYPDCEVAKTTVLGEANEVHFKANGKIIKKEGWRVLFPKNKNKGNFRKGKEDEEKVLPDFKVGESGPHEPKLVEKMTQPPKNYTEATLLRSMETAGKQVDDEELRELMKENGIGRPSTRANIIETLFRRKYIIRNKKQILPTDMGVQLIDVIKNDLLKSAELTGQWEKQLRDIASGDYSAATFINNMKNMVNSLTHEIRNTHGVKKIINPEAEKNKYSSKGNSSTKFGAVAAKKAKAKKIGGNKTGKSPNASASSMSEMSCPKCFKGKLLKGSSAYGCSRYTENCTFRLPFSFMEKRISENQLKRLMKMGSTVNLKGFKLNGKKVEGKVRFDADFGLQYEAKSSRLPTKISPRAQEKAPDKLPCPKCQKGQILKGKSAYGCSRYTEGCDWRFAFDAVFKAANGRALTRELVWEILRQ